MDFSPENKHLLERSFKEFCAKPENEILVEKAQKHEVKQVIKIRDLSSRLEFERQVQDAGEEVVQNLAPFMKNRVLRRIVQTLGNSSNTSLAEWANNPRVLEMFGQALALIEDGRISETELERLMIMQLKDDRSPDAATFKQLATTEVVLPTQLLVSALNEHASDRQKGNQAFRAQKYDEAMKFYTRARAVVEFVRGGNIDDQSEVANAKVAVLLDMSALSLAQQEYGSASQLCSEALQLDAVNVSALLSRAKAHIARHQFEDAKRDLHHVHSLEPSNAEACKLQKQTHKLMLAAEQTDRKFFSKMFPKA